MTIPPVKEKNLTITCGASFDEIKFIKNEDGSAVDLTGHTFTARMGKHFGAVDANTSTVVSPVKEFTDLTVIQRDIPGGEISFGLIPSQTEQLNEGKYVYSILMDDGAGVITEVARGLIFVVKSF